MLRDPFGHIDSQLLHFEAERKTLSHFGHRITDEELKKYLGWNENAFWDEMKSIYNIHESVAVIRKTKKPLFESLLKKALKPDYALQRVLTDLRKKGLRLAVASSAPKQWIFMTLEGLAIRSCFDAIVSGDTLKRSKPFPDIFLKAAKDLGVEPQACVVIEDAPAGILAANRANMYAIALHVPTNQGCDLSAANREINNLSELAQLLTTLI